MFNNPCGEIALPGTSGYVLPWMQVMMMNHFRVIQGLPPFTPEEAAVLEKDLEEQIMAEEKIDPEVEILHFEGDALAKAKAFLLEQLQAEDVSGEQPKHDAFEVEDCNTRKNFVFAKKDGCVTCYDTSRGAGNIEMFSFSFDGFDYPQPNPSTGKNFENADEYFLYLFHKALNFVDNVGFIGYVNDKTFEPIEE